MQTPDFWAADSLAQWQSDLAGTFERWLAQQRVAVSRQLRASSVLTYTAMFNQWLAFLQDRRLHLLEARTTDALAFFEGLDLEPVSRRRYLQLLDRVYRHLLLLGWQGANPLVELLSQEQELQLDPPSMLTRQEEDRLVQALREGSAWKDMRDRALAALMLGAGLRNSEVAFLSPNHVHQDFRIDVRPRTVHPPHTTLVLPDGPWREWLDLWLQRSRESASSVVCASTLAGKPFAPSSLFRRVSKWFAQADISPDRGGVNVLRNTFAHRALTCGRYKPYEVQQFLGHTQSRSTERHLASP